VDYKTNRLEDLSPDEVVASDYSLQRLIYALATLRAGAAEVEVDFVFLERPDDVVRAVFDRDAIGSLERELSDAIASIQAGEFHPTPSELACAGCPALDRICAGPRLGLGPSEGTSGAAVAAASA
jgi:hypothetical protein